MFVYQTLHNNYNLAKTNSVTLDSFKKACWYTV